MAQFVPNNTTQYPDPAPSSRGVPKTNLQAGCSPPGDVHLENPCSSQIKPLQEVPMPFLIRPHRATVRAQHPLSITQFCSECRKRRVQVSPLHLREPPRHPSAQRGVRSLPGGRQHSALESLLLLKQLHLWGLFPNDC